MTKEQRFFLSTIKDYICGIETRTEDVDWQKVFDYSKSHQLTSIVYHQCKSFMPQSIVEPFKSYSLSTVYSNINRRNVTDNILTTLRQNGIVCFSIKGFNIADFYPNWQYRTMGDTDIVVDNLEKAHAILLKNGFRTISKIKGREYQYSKKNMEFELHDRMVYNEAINLDSTTEFLNDYEKYVKDGKLDESFHFIFILNHLRRHFMNRGVGFRQFVDVAILIMFDDKINWLWVEEKLEEIGLLPFAKTVFYYIGKWFGVFAPIEPKNATEIVFKESTDYVFNNGVFGFDNCANEKYLVSNAVRLSKWPKLTMVKSAWQTVFPKYKSFISSESYSFLREKPLLLPFVWVHRIAIGLKQKGLRVGMRQISKSFVSEEYIAKREEMFKNWDMD